MYEIQYNQLLVSPMYVILSVVNLDYYCACMFSYILCIQDTYASTPKQMPTQMCTYSILSLITTATQPPPSPHTHMQRHTCRQCQAYMHVRANIDSETHASHGPTHTSHNHVLTNVSFTDELFFRWGKRPLMSVARQYAVRRHCG